MDNTALIIFTDDKTDPIAVQVVDSYGCCTNSYYNDFDDAMAYIKKIGCKPVIAPNYWNLRP